MRFLSLIALICISGLCSCQSKKSTADGANGSQSLGGKHGGESRQIKSPEEFNAPLFTDADEENSAGKGLNAPVQDSDFIAFADELPAAHSSAANTPTPQANNAPGEAGSAIPSIEAFIDVDDRPDLRTTFAIIPFAYNSSLIKDGKLLDRVSRMATYLKNHPRTYLFIEGHCDDRGSSAYNFALGANRANAVRDFLVKEGVDPTHIFTISYGKERPLAIGANEEVWSINRRCQFRIYELK